MHKSLITFLFCFLFCFLSSAQEKKELDSVQTALKKENIVIQDSLTLTKRKEIDPLGPSKAAFYSAVLPGLGQIYNKKYWKAPIAWAAVGGGVYAYTYYNSLYKRSRTAFKSRKAGFITDEFYYRFDNNEPDAPGDYLDLEDLQNDQERFQRDRDLWLLYTIAIYALNVIDANVDAHLKQYNIDENLSMDFKPYIDYNEITASPTYGMALTVKF